MTVVIKIENLSKQYRLGLVSTRTLSHDLNRWWTMNVLGKDDPYLKIGETVQSTGHRAQSTEHRTPEPRALSPEPLAEFPEPRALSPEPSGKRSRDGEYIWALKDINLEIKQGEVLGIIGKNGAGKSTLLKILSKVTAPTTGTIRAKGRIASLLEVGTGFHPEMTGRENIYMNGAVMGMSKAEITRKFDEIVDFAGVETFIDTPVKRYSSGMLVRLGFAVAAHLEPEILVVDEILAVGDAEFQKKAIGKMHDVSKLDGRTVLFVSHNMGSIKSLCNNGIVLNKGITSFSGNINESVDYYLKLNRSLINDSLIEREDRVGSQEISATAAYLTSENGERINSVLTGQTFFVCIEYVNKTDQTYQNVVISLSVKDSSENPVFLIHNRLTGDRFNVPSGKGKFECRLNKFPLNEGNYYLSYSLSKDNGKNGYFDGISDVMELVVEKGDFYRTGEIAPKSFGDLVVDGKFEISNLK